MKRREENRKRKKNLNKWRCTAFMNWKTKHSKDVNSPKLIYRFIGKISANLGDIDKLSGGIRGQKDASESQAKYEESILLRFQHLLFSYSNHCNDITRGINRSTE